jgi:hypothetical protein
LFGVGLKNINMLLLIVNVSLFPWRQNSFP